MNLKKNSTPMVLTFNKNKITNLVEEEVARAPPTPQ
jgi:hypothetical protein